MKLGLLAYGTDTGLGVQTHNLYEYLQPTKTMLIDLQEMNGMPVHRDWYRKPQVVKGIPTPEAIDEFLEGLDIVFVCETPLNYYLFGEARRRGIVTVLQYNFEFLDYFSDLQLPRPTVFAAPSLWNIERMEPRIFGTVTPLPVPVDERSLQKRTITEANHFFHSAGRPAIHDRNGTMDFIEAAKLALSHEPGMQFTVYCQTPTMPIINAVRGTKIKLIQNLPNYSEIYTEGDVMVMPRKYGGLCLPVNEALYCGIPVLMPDIDPNNRLLPEEFLLPADPRATHFFTRTSIEIRQTQIGPMAQRMLDLYRHPEAVRLLAWQARVAGEFMGWSAQQSRYKTFLEGLCHTSVSSSR